MNDQIVEALTNAGLSPSPLGILEHANSFFALYSDQLVYREGERLSRVALPDVTRIHSDREGVLRVETSERTAVTASLLGYEPGQVQQFFQQVRDVTARAKELPVMPLNRAIKPEPALSPLAATPLPAAQPAQPQPTSAQLIPVQPTPMPATSQPAAPLSTPPAAPPAAPTSRTGIPPVMINPPVSSTSIPVVGGFRPDLSKPEPAAAEPLVISIMPAVRDVAPPRKTTPTVVKIQSGGTLGEPETVQPAEPALAPAPVVSAPASPVAALSLSGRDLLRARAESVQGFAGSIRLLAVVLGLAALGLAFVQYRDNQTISAVWTLLTGGVGMVALLAFAEALRFLAALGAELGADGSAASGISGRE